MKKITIPVLLVFLSACGLSVDKSKMENQSQENISGKNDTTQISDSSSSIKEQSQEKKANENHPVISKKPYKEKTELIDIAQDTFTTSYYYKPLPAVIKNTFSAKGTKMEFNRSAVYPGTPGIGCSQSSNDLSFIIDTVSGSFIIENEALRNIQFKYNESGGLYWASGENPFKGKITGKMLPDKTWNIEVDVWLKIKNDIDGRESEQQIKMNDIFSLSL